jgi:hypothetical protein
VGFSEVDGSVVGERHTTGTVRVAEVSPMLSISLLFKMSVKDLLCCTSFGGLSAAPGGTNVSGPREVRRPKRLLLRLLSFPFFPAGFVGVGGSSSALDWLSGLPAGE